MYRSGHAASLSRSSLRYVSSATTRNASNLARARPLKQQLPRNLSLRKAPTVSLVLHKPLTTSVQRYATTPGPFDKIDKKHEELVEHEKLEVHPEDVSSTSSVHQLFQEKGVEESEEKDEDMLAGIKADLVGLSLAFVISDFTDIKGYRKPSRKPLLSMKSHEKPSLLEWQVSYLTLQHHSPPCI